MNPFHVIDEFARRQKEERSARQERLATKSQPFSVGLVFLIGLFLAYLPYTGNTQVSAPTTVESREEGTSLGFGRIFNFTTPTLTVTFGSNVFTIAEGITPRVRATSTTSTQSVASSTWTSIALEIEDYDTDTMHDTVTNNTRLTATRAGTYILHAIVTWDSNTTNERRVRLLANGTTIVAGAFEVHTANAGVANLAMNTSGQIALTAGQYVEFQVWQNTGIGITTIRDSAVTPYFSMVRVGS